MRNLNHSAACSDAVLKSIFIEQLPAQARGIVVASKLTSLQEIGELADTVVEAMQPSHPEVYLASLQNSEPNPMQARLDKLSQELADLTVLVKRQANSRSRSRSMSAQDGTQAGYCWKHKRFGEKAFKCTPPCTWKGAAPAENS